MEASVITTQARTSNAKKAASGIPMDVLEDALKDDLSARQTTKRTVTEAGPGGQRSAAKKKEEAAPVEPSNQTALGSTYHRMHLDPSAGSGSVFMATGASEKHTVADQLSLTQAYQGYKREHPDWSEDMLWAMASREDYNPGGDVARIGMSQDSATEQQKTQHKRRSGRKLAIIVGNEKYPDVHWHDLPGAKADADRMKSQCESEGYDTVRIKGNLDSGTLQAVFESVATAARRGDEVLMYYAGHGLPYGLVGARSTCTKWDYHTPEWGDFTDVMPNAVLGALAARAVSGGWHLRLVVDACHSEGAANAVLGAVAEHALRYETTPLAIDSDEVKAKGIPNVNGRYKGSNLEADWKKRFSDE